MKNCLCIILFLVLSLTIPITSAYAYGGDGDGDGDGVEVESTSSDTTKPPSGFTPVEQESIEISSETDPGNEEEVEELVEDVNAMEDTEEGDDKTNVSSSNPYSNMGTHLIGWVKLNPVKAWRDSFVNRVPRGQCCVDASKDRASDIAAHLQSLVNSGELNLGNHTIKVGSRSGYKVPLSGWLLGDKTNTSTHTYTVVQINDANGKFQGAFEVDTYVANIVLPHSKVDLDKEWPGHVRTVVPRKSDK